MNLSKKGDGQEQMRKLKTPQRADLTEIKPDSLIRLKDVLQFIRVSKSSWHNGVKLGLYPKGFVVGRRTRLYRG
ncbi:MAG: hypothetical protein WCO89_13150, partial [Syntrophus sp. (in: bacteria)]